MQSICHCTQKLFWLCISTLQNSHANFARRNMKIKSRFFFPPLNGFWDVQINWMFLNMMMLCMNSTAKGKFKALELKLSFFYYPWIKFWHELTKSRSNSTMSRWLTWKFKLNCFIFHLNFVFSFSDLMDALAIFKVKGLITQLGRKILLLPLESRNTNKFEYTLE